MKKLTKKQLQQRVLLFCYGSNILQSRLEQRVGKVELYSVYDLPGYCLAFNVVGEFANIVPEVGSWCQGVIYELTYEQLRMLDKYEAFYRRDNIIITNNFVDRKLHFYVAKYITEEQPVLTHEYAHLIRQGCEQHNLQESLRILNEQQTLLADWEIKALWHRPDTFDWKVYHQRSKSRQ